MGDKPMETVAQLQSVLDASPNTIIYLFRSTFEIDKANPKPIKLHSNRSLVMDAATKIRNRVTMPPTVSLPPQNVSGYGGVVILSGSNIARTASNRMHSISNASTGQTETRAGAAISVSMSTKVPTSRS